MKARSAAQTREVAVYDGQIYLGRIVISGKTYTAFDWSDCLIGDFASVNEASGRMPAPGEAANRDGKRFLGTRLDGGTNAGSEAGGQPS